MDPLSITTSVITLIAALGAVKKGYKAISDLGKAPEEFSDLVYEIESVHAYLGLLYSTLQQALSQRQFNSVDLSAIHTPLSRIEKTVQDLEAASRLAETDSKTSETGRRISKVKWQIYRTKIEQLRDQVRQRKRDVSDAIGLLQLLSSVLNTSLMQAANAGLQPTNGQARTANTHSLDYSLPGQYPACSMTICACRCHKPDSIHSPSRAKPMRIVSFLLMSLYIKTSLCDDDVCRTVQQQQIDLLCHIPFLHRAFSFRLGWKATFSLEANLYLRMPRLVDDDCCIVNTARYGSVQLMRYLVEKRVAFPNDTDSQGRNLINCAIRNGEQMIEYLMEVGADPSQEDIWGHSAIRSYNALASLCYGEQWAVSRRLEVVAEARRPPNPLDRPLLDAIKDRDHNTIKGILEEDPSRAIQHDAFGNTPLSFAAVVGCPVSVELLIRHWTEPVLDGNECPHGTRLVYLATFFHHWAVVRLFLKKFYIATDAAWLAIQAVDCTSNNALAEILATECISPVGLLLVFKAFIEAPQRDWAGPEECLRLLVQYGLRFDHMLGEAIDRAVQLDNPYTTQALVAGGAKGGIIQLGNSSLLCSAAKFATLETIDVLRKANITVLDPDKEGCGCRRPRGTLDPLEHLIHRETAPGIEIVMEEMHRPTPEESEALRLLLREVAERSRALEIEFDPDKNEEEIVASVPGAWRD